MIDKDQLNQMIQDQLAEKSALFRQACHVLMKNQECYIAQWIIQNHDVSIDDYAIVNRPTEDGLGYITSLELKSTLSEFQK